MNQKLADRLHLHSRSGSVRSALLLSFTALTGAAHAQTPAPAPTTPAVAEGEVVVLDTFNVSSERGSGYVASNSISGTRSNTPIREIPLNIQVFTTDFANDFNITNQVDLERYNAALINGGADKHSDNVIQQQYQGALFRGFIQNWGLRDGVRNYDPIDMQGIARLEVVKGPAAPLYGVTYPGGVKNAISKQVDFRKNFSEITASLQTEGQYRATIDTNQVGNAAVGRVGVRFNGAMSDTKDYREHSDGSIQFSQVNLSWRPQPTTEFTFLYEDGYREKAAGLGYFTAPGPLGNGADIPLQVTHPNIPWTWNWATGNMRSLDMRLYRGAVTHEITKDFTITAYYQYSRRVQTDSNGWDGAGGGGSAASWDVGWSSAGGWFDSGWINPNTPGEFIKLSYHQRDWRNQMRAYGTTAVYELDLGDVKNTFTFGGAAYGERFTTHKGTVPSTSTNFVIFPVRAGINTRVQSPPPPDFFMDAAGAYNRENSSNDYYFATWQGSFFENRLRLNAAVNRTNIQLINWANGVTTEATINEQSETSPMFGAMYDITPEISAFYGYSSSFFPTTLKNDFEVQMPPVTGKGHEVGVKVSLLEGKISGTVSAYKITQEGDGQIDPSATNRNRQRWDSLTPAERLIVFPGVTDRSQLTNRSGQAGDYVPGAEAESTGFEADLVFQPTREWQIITSYAHNSQEVTSAINKKLIGKSSSGTIKNQFASYSRYTFLDGPAQGLSLGLGFQYAGKALQDYTGPNGDIARYNPATLWVETFAGYKFKRWGFDHTVQLNIKNLTKQEEFVGWKETGSAARLATERYEVPTETVFSLTYGLQF